MDDIFFACFSKVKDPRIARSKKHLLIDVFAITLCAILAGSQSYREIHWFGKSYEDWFKKRLLLPNGIPSIATFNRIFNMIDAQAFQQESLIWLKKVNKVFCLPEGVIAIDGKTMKGSKDPANTKSPFHIVSAFSSNHLISLGQVAVNDKSNEITAIPEILRLLEISGATITIDAMGCQKEIVRQIFERGADYVIGLKSNHKNLFTAVQKHFALQDEQASDVTCRSVSDEPSTNHGREDYRKIEVVSAHKVIPFVHYEWAGLKSFARITHTRIMSGKEPEVFQRYYISSLTPTLPGNILESTRSHWDIENKLHWTLDVIFREDSCRIRDKTGALNFAWLRKLSLGILKNHNFDLKGLSIRVKQQLICMQPEIWIPAILGGLR